MILVIASNPFKSVDELAKKLALDFGAVYKQLEDDFLLKNAGFFEEQKTGNFVYSGVVIAGKMSGQCTKVYLRESEERILNRIAKDQKLAIEKAKEIFDSKIKSEKERLKRFFGIELYNQEMYDLIINIDKLNNKGIIDVIEKFVARRG